MKFHVGASLEEPACFDLNLTQVQQKRLGLLFQSFCILKNFTVRDTHNRTSHVWSSSSWKS